jgi:hypothetical protein
MTRGGGRRKPGYEPWVWIGREISKGVHMLPDNTTRVFGPASGTKTAQIHHGSKVLSQSAKTANSKYVSNDLLQSLTL